MGIKGTKGNVGNLGNMGPPGKMVESITVRYCSKMFDRV